MKNFKFSSSANGKVFRNGLYSTAILAAAIVLAVLINLLVDILYAVINPRICFK